MAYVHQAWCSRLFGISELDMDLFPGNDFAKWVCAAKYKSSTSQRSTKLSFVQNEIAKITDRPVSTTPITIYVANLDFHLNKHTEIS